MRHKYKGRKLGTSYGHTKAMKVSLVRALFLNDRIKTTETRAKEIRGDVDRIITWAKRGDLHSRRLAIAALGNDSDLVREIFEKVNQGMFKDRPGGYTRIMKLGPRKGDGARMVIIELITENCVPKAERKTAAGKSASKKATPKPKAKKDAEEAAKKEVAEQEAENEADRENLAQRLHDSVEAAIEEESAEIHEEGEAQLAAEEAEAKKEEAKAEKENAEAAEEVRDEEMKAEAESAKNAEAADKASKPEDMREFEEHAK